MDGATGLRELMAAVAESLGVTLEDRGDGTTLATYSLAVDPGMWVPGPVLKVLNNQVMRGAVEDLKQRVEAAARA